MTGRLDRRALFTSGAAAALLAASGVSLEAAPQRGGKLRLAVPKPHGLMPGAMRGAVFNTLTEVAPDGVLRGELASGWTGSSDGRVWDVTLRDGVAFHDGTLLEAAHVMDMLGQAPELGVAEAAPITGGVRIVLTQPNPQLPYRLADPARIVARPGMIGTGLYRVDRFDPGRSVFARRVETHFKDGQAGWFDSIEIVVISDPRVRAEALREGYVDVAELPLADGLAGHSDFQFHPSADKMALAARAEVNLPRMIGRTGALDDGRIAERWWMA